MLTESFVASVLSGQKSTNSSATKDVGIHLHDFQPIAALKASFKKSSTPANCLAVSASHIFAAQADKAVIHVYNRERGNQEAIVPFPERIHTVAFAGDPNGAGVLLLGTEGGRVNLWELCTGRQISTPQSHLQATTCLAVDPTANFLLSGSLDSNIHVWSIPALLSFSAPSANDISQPSPYAPVRTLPNHRAAITTLTVGHSSSNTNIAVSGSKDNTCIVWDYHTGTALHTFLLPSTPLCLTLDPADRAVYAGYDDGSVQLIDFYKNPSLTQALYDPGLQSTPTQPPPTDRWALPSAATSVALCLDVSYDGTTILSGHQNGKVQTWDVAKGRYNIQLADFSAPVTNLQMLPLSGFPNTPEPSLKIHNVIKPRYESSLDGGGNIAATGRVPANYTFTAQFNSTLSSATAPSSSNFHSALNHSSFPAHVLEEGIAELATWGSPKPHSQPSTNDSPTTEADDEVTALQKTNSILQAQLLLAQQAQKSSMAQVLELNHERTERMQQDEAKAKRKKARRLLRMTEAERRRKAVMGMAVGRSEEGDENGGGDEEMGENGESEKREEEEELSSSTDEMTPSD